MKYTIIIEKASKNYSAYSPDLPGCVSTGQTLRETKRNMTEAIEFHLEDLRTRHQRIPRPVSVADLVEV